MGEISAIDTSNNAELDIEKGTGLTSIIRVCAFHKELITDITDPLYGGYESWWDFPPGKIYLKIRLLKEDVVPVKGTFNHCTNLWILVGEFPFDHTKELKVKSYDVIDFDSKIGSIISSALFTNSFVERTGMSCLADIEQASLLTESQDPIKTLQASIAVPQAIINQYDGYLGISK